MYLLDSRLWMLLSIRSHLPPSGAALIRGQAESRLLCFLSVSQDSESRSEKGGGRVGGEVGAKEKQANGHLPMMQGNPPQDDWKVRMSHFPLGVRLSIIPPRYRWVPVRSGVNFSYPPSFFSAALQSFQHGFPSTVRKKQLGVQFDFE